MLHDLAEPEMMKVVNQARAERSRELARMISKLFQRRPSEDGSVAVGG